MQINWALSADEASQVLNALAERPFKEVNSLIAKLHMAAKTQVAEYEKGPANGTDGTT